MSVDYLSGALGSAEDIERNLGGRDGTFYDREVD